MSAGIRSSAQRGVGLTSTHSRAADMRKPQPRRSGWTTSTVSERRDRMISVAVLVYTNLWVVEGALRKWVPGTESPLYVARDVLFIGIIVLAAILAPTTARRGVGFIFWTFVAAFSLVVALQLINGASAPALALIGARSLIGPAFVLYVAIRYPVRGLWERVAKTVVIYAPVQALITVLQVSSPASAPINLIMGGEEVGLGTANGVVRASGTFSAPAGLTLFVPVAIACSLYFIFRARDSRQRRWGVTGLCATLLVVALGGSRGAVVAALLVLAVCLLRVLAEGSLRGISLAFGLIILIGAVLLIVATLFPTVVEAFGIRVQVASEAEDPWQRWLRFFAFMDYPITALGEGIGIHSNAAGAFLTTVKWLESENVRWVAELGFLGVVLVLARITCGVALILWAAIRFRNANLMSVLASVVIINVLLAGSISTQPTYQGQIAILALLAIGSSIDSRKSSGGTPAHGLAHTVDTHPPRSISYPSDAPVATMSSGARPLGTLQLLRKEHP